MEGSGGQTGTHFSYHFGRDFMISDKSHLLSGFAILSVLCYFLNVQIKFNFLYETLLISTPICCYFISFNKGLRYVHNSTI